MCCNKNLSNDRVVTFEKWRLAAREGDAYQVDKWHPKCTEEEWNSTKSSEADDELLIEAFPHWQLSHSLQTLFVADDDARRHHGRPMRNELICGMLRNMP